MSFNRTKLASHERIEERGTYERTILTGKLEGRGVVARCKSDKNFVSVAANKSCHVARRIRTDCCCFSAIVYVHVRGAKTLSSETGGSRLFRRSAIAYALNRLLCSVSHLSGERSLRHPVALRGSEPAGPRR